MWGTHHHVNESSSSSDGQSFLGENYTLLAVSLLICSAVFAVVSFWLREVCFDACGMEVCAGSISTARMRELRRQRRAAQRLQREIMERHGQDSSYSVPQQEERRKVYGEYLKNYSKVRRIEKRTKTRLVSYPSTILTKFSYLSCPSDTHRIRFL